MARTTTKTAVDTVEENMNEEIEVKKNEPLHDSDEIDVISLVPNVSYKDSKTLDMYQWDEADHIEPMTFETLKNMWRSNKGYFKNLWLKPNDERVINKFGLTKTFENYEYLMESSNYTKKNIKSICDKICDAPNGLKFAVCDKVKSFVISGDISDVAVIRTLENRLKIDLIQFL